MHDCGVTNGGLNAKKYSYPSEIQCEIRFKYEPYPLLVVRLCSKYKGPAVMKTIWPTYKKV